MALLPCDVRRRIYAWCDVQTLLQSCRAVSNTDRKLVREVEEARLEGVYATFATDTARMRRFMRENSVFLTGGLALGLFSPFAPVDRSVELYVGLSRVDLLLCFLCNTEGFVEDPRQANQPPISFPNEAIRDSEVTTFRAGVVRMNIVARGDTVVKVYAYAEPKEERLYPDPLCFSWTTLVFNFVTSDYAMCAYPSMTMRGRGLFHYNRVLDASFPGGTSDHALNEYTAGGYEFDRHPSGWFPWPETRCEGGWSCPFRERGFGDGGCVRMPAASAGAGRVVRARTWVFGGVSEDVHSG
ncbi:hypothetical protein OH77DRAFT_1402549 [Trametes cingulata]|nr:hypothetical protein OH77DRAFT_1402549 [Trametes cingulata]